MTAGPRGDSRSEGLPPHQSPARVAAGAVLFPASPERGSDGEARAGAGVKPRRQRALGSDGLCWAGAPAAGPGAEDRPRAPRPGDG